MKKSILSLIIISVILISGCVSTVKPVEPADVIVNVAPITMKEFQEQDITVNVLNNATLPIDNVKVSSFDTFTVIDSGIINIPPRTQDGPSELMINAKIQAPGFTVAGNTTMLTISYASGTDDKGNQIVRTKFTPIQTLVLPNVKLQFVGFVKGLKNLSEAETTSMTLGKGENATITFSVKNEGMTTIDENTLRVVVDVVNKRIGTNNSIVINNAMAKAGTSNTLGIQVPILNNAPNGETDVTVTLFMGDNIIDMKTLQLAVKL